RWLSLLEYCIQRLKDKQFRRVSMDAILRMLWVYLFRYPESRGVVLRRIDSLSRIFFPATKIHAWPKTVPLAAFVYFLVCAACYDFDFTARQLLHTLLQTDSGWPGTTRGIGDAEPILDTLNPMRVGLAFQAIVNVAAIATARSRAAGADPADAGAATAAAATSTASGAAAAADDAAASAAAANAAVLCPPFPGVAQLGGLDVLAADAPDAAGALAIDLELLPEAISNALATATSVVSRYCSVLYPVFGRFVLADERLWRQACALPLFSSVVLTGTPFSLENTALQAPASSRGEQRSHHSGQASGAMAAGAAAGGGAGAAGAHSGSVAANAGATGDNASDRHFTDDMDGAGAGGTGGDSAPGGGGGGGGGGSPRTTSDAIRQLAPRPSPDRQAYVDLMTVHIRCVPRAQIFWEQLEPQRLVEMLVHNVLHVDQQLAAESRACLMDLLCPPSIAHQRGLADAGRRPAGMFSTRTERLVCVTQAV
ncbi:Cell morphogenesis protein PAG1, partial [Coemansia nantahalensis]